MPVYNRLTASLTRLAVRQSTTGQYTSGLGATSTPTGQKRLNIRDLEASRGSLGVIVGPLGGFWEASCGLLWLSWDFLAENVEKKNNAWKVGNKGSECERGGLEGGRRGVLEGSIEGGRAGWDWDRKQGVCRGRNVRANVCGCTHAGTHAHAHTHTFTPRTFTHTFTPRANVCLTLRERPVSRGQLCWGNLDPAQT